MVVQEMHYDFKQKLNKIDSQKYRNLLIPEVDWKLNEAAELFVKTIAEPRYNPQIGVEFNQRSIDDIRTVVVDDYVSTITPFGDQISYRATLPDDYWFLLNSNVIASKGKCTMQPFDRTNERTHDEEPESSPFDSSSFEWRECNYRFFKDGLRYFTDGTFTIDVVSLDYIKRMPYIHFAQGTGNQTYTLPSGEALTGTQDCILPVGTHREIVDIAVLIATGDLQMADYQIKVAKVKMND